MLTRRHFFKAGVACGALAMTGARARLAFAALPDDRRFIVVILRGGLDGLAAVPAHGDPDYAAAARQSCAARERPRRAHRSRWFLRAASVAAQSGRDVACEGTGDFPQRLDALSRPLAFRRAERAGDRCTKPHLLNDGWLNRALAPLALDTGNGRLAVSSSPPLLLDGPARVTSWMPSHMPVPDEEFLMRVGALYEKDAVLAGWS